MRKNPQRLAWLVLLVSFALCGITATVVPAAATRLVEGHTSTRPARLDIIYGTVLVRQAGATGEQGAADDVRIEPGDSVRTAEYARAILWLFDDSNVELGPDTTVTLRESRGSTFSGQFSAIALHVSTGKPSVNVGLPRTKDRVFMVTTALGDVELGEGSYEIDLSRPGLAEAITRVGTALVSAEGETIVCKTGQRAELRPGEPPAGPLSLARNLIENGEFNQPVDDEHPIGPNWRADERDTEGQLGWVRREEARSGYYLRFFREGKGHGENYVVQTIDRDVSQFRSLRLLVDIRLVNQTLSGGGIAGSEYPFHIRLSYRDARGREGRKTVGFYYHNPENLPTPIGIQWPQNQWRTYELDLLDPAEIDPRPVYLFDLELVASGWDYESHVRNVRLMAE